MDPIAAAVLASWTLDWPTLCVLAAVGALYLLGWQRLHEEMPHKYTTGKLGSFLGGLIAVALALQSPIDAFGSLLLQAHMVQHLLLITIGAPFILLGQPVLPMLRGLPRWIFKDALGPFLACRELKQLGRLIVHPVVTWSAMTAVMVVWHFPHLYDLALRVPFWHEAEHACFFWAAILFWWPVIGVWPGDPVWPRWAMIPYLLFTGMVNMGLSAILSFSEHVLYTSYALAPRLWGISALDDQAAAGGIMWVPGSIATFVPAVILGTQLLETSRVRPAPTVRRTLAPHRVEPWAWIGPILRHRYFRRSMQAVMLVLAGAVAIDGFSGPQVAPMNLAGVLPWIHWRGLAVIALLMAGNLFCMACPFTMPRDLARKFVAPPFRWPLRLRSKWIATALVALYLWAYEAFSLWDRPSATAWIIVGYFVMAFAVDIAFKGASFCKYVCPIGQFHFVQSMVSPLEIGVRDAAVCEPCMTHDCIRGNTQQRGCELQLFQPKKLGNFDCTFCLDCVQACPQQNVGIRPAAPVRSLLGNRLSLRADVAALTLILVFGAFVNAAGMTGPVTMWMHRWHARLGSMLPVVTLMYAAGLLVIPAALVAMCVWLSRLTVRATAQDLGCGFTLALIPVGFSMWLAHFSNHLFAAWSIALPPSVELIALGMGLLLTLYAAWRIAHRFATADSHALAVMSPWAVLACALYATGVWIVFQPMQMRGMMVH